MRLVLKSPYSDMAPAAKIASATTVSRSEKPAARRFTAVLRAGANLDISPAAALFDVCPFALACSLRRAIDRILDGEREVLAIGIYAAIGRLKYDARS